MTLSAEIHSGFEEKIDVVGLVLFCLFSYMYEQFFASGKCILYNKSN